MSIDELTLLLLAGLAFLMAIGLPLGFGTGLLALGFGLALYGPASLPIVASRIYSFVNEYALIAVPMFVLMAAILERSGITRELFRVMHIFAGRLPGGLAVQTTLVAVLMAAMTGIIGGEIVLLGMVALPQMLARGYDRRLAIGTICAGGSLGTMIPPSIVLIFYGLTASVPIGDLFLAAIVPGLMLGGFYILYIVLRCTFRPSLAPVAASDELEMGWAEKIALLRHVVLPVFVIATVLGSIYAGIASVSEAAAMGVLGVMLSAAVRGELSWGLLRDSLHQTAGACGAIIWLTFGATMLIGVYNLMGGVRFVSDMVTGLDLPPLAVVALMMAILALLGFFMDWVGILLLTMPIFVPIVEKMGFDLVWFGVLFCMNMQISYLTPPFGPAAFYLKSVAPPEIELHEIFRALWPFIGLQAAALALVLLFPQIVLWLPQAVR